MVWNILQNFENENIHLNMYIPPIHRFTMLQVSICSYIHTVQLWRQQSTTQNRSRLSPRHKFTDCVSKYTFAIHVTECTRYNWKLNRKTHFTNNQESLLHDAHCNVLYCYYCKYNITDIHVPWIINIVACEKNRLTFFIIYNKERIYMDVHFSVHVPCLTFSSL